MLISSASGHPAELVWKGERLSEESGETCVNIKEMRLAWADAQTYNLRHFSKNDWGVGGGNVAEKKISKRLVNFETQSYK